MKRTNKFSGIKLTHETVFTYYKNPNHPDFDHFVFQPMIDDDGNPDGDNFTLAAYAVTDKLKVLNDGNPLPATDMDDTGAIGTKPCIQFANMKLNKEQLGTLYKSAKSGLSFYPPKPISYFKDTAYVQYIAETAYGFEHEKVLITSKIDPSPPA